MSMDTLADQIPGALQEVAPPTKTLLEHLHEWVVTVDHKKLGLMYIMYALLFLLVGGVEATISSSSWSLRFIAGISTPGLN